MPTRARFHPVNPTAIRSLRRQLGWSQAELGRRAGYCERVIRKAEAGGSLSINTIENLVQTFVTNNLQVTTRELIYSEDILAQRFLSSYDSLGLGMLKDAEPFLTEDFVFHIPAEQSILEIAGTYEGKTRFQEFLNQFFSHFKRKTDSLTPTYLTGKGRVVAHFDEQLEYQGTALPPVWVNLHFYFRGGQISRVEAQFDYALALAAIERISASAASSLDACREINQSITNPSMLVGSSDSRCDQIAIDEYDTPVSMTEFMNANSETSASNATNSIPTVVS